MRPRRTSLVAVALVLSLAGAFAAGDPGHAPPSQLFDELYVAVAESGAFSDFKQFADAVPREPPPAVLADYRRERPHGTAALSSFVARHFTFERTPLQVRLPPRGLTIENHIEALWPILTRETRNVPPYSSLLPLPKPFVVPGGRFTELYYWDSYFTMLGFGPRERALRNGMIADFAYMIRTYGHIPNGNRTYYLSRSQPPFFFKMIALTDPGHAPQAYARFLPELKAEYRYWMAGEERASSGRPFRNVVRMPDGSVLNRYWDARDTPRDEEYPKDLALARISHEPKDELYRNIRAAAESGWDFSSRWLADGHTLATIETTDIVPVDLNSLLYGLERAIEQGCESAKDGACAKEFEQRAERRRAAMNRYLWDAKRGAFFDYDWNEGKSRPILSAATLYPLFVREADDAQARAVANVVRADLLERGGLATTRNHTGQQWDAPNGWAPLQWIAVDGLSNYAQTDLADAIAGRWLETVVRNYAASGRLVEKYNVENPEAKGGGGEYKLQDGFGWTNGVTIALLQLCPPARTGVPLGSRRCEAQ